MEDCERPHEAHGLCGTHYKRLRNTGTTRLRTTEDRFWEKCSRLGDDECWPWLAAKSKAGYGSFRYGNQSQPAHRVAYELLVGPIPEGLVIDHLCRNPNCVNPAHMEPVTHSENERRKHGDTCKRGHPFTPENTYLHPQRGSRSCKTCANERSRKWRAS